MSIAAMPIGGNNLNRYLIPTPVPSIVGPAIFAPASFIPHDGFWSREMDRIIIISESNAAVYNYDGVRNVITLHQTAGLVGGRNGDLNGAGDRIAAVRANNLTVLAYDRVTGLLSADITLTDAVHFSHVQDCAWDPTGEFIAVANDDSSAPNRLVTIVRYVRSPASLTVVASFGDITGGNRRGVAWGANDVITAGGVQLGFWGFRFDRVTNVLTRFANIGGMLEHNSVEASPTGEWIAGFDHTGGTNPDVHIFRFTPSPDTLTHQNTITLPIGMLGSISPVNGKIQWDSNSRNILLNTGPGATALGILRMDPVGLGAVLHGSIPTTATLFKAMVNNIHQVIAVLRNSSTAPIEIRPWASNINI